MGRHRLTRLAENDLEEIGDFIALDKPEAALHFVNRIREVCATLANHPEMGRLHPRPKCGELRAFSVGHYLIFYRKIATGVEIARVLHGARDIDSQLE